MKIELCELDSDVHDEFSGVDGMVWQSCGDIYIDNEPFGYYFSVWPELECKKIDIVVFAVDMVARVVRIGVGASYIISENLIDLSLTDFMYDDDWRDFNDFVKPAELEFYTSAIAIIKILPDLFVEDPNLKAEILENKGNPYEAKIHAPFSPALCALLASQH